VARPLCGLATSGRGDDAAAPAPTPQPPVGDGGNAI